MELNHVGSLITVKDKDGEESCLGFLMNFDGHGVFSPDGKVEVSVEDMKRHNALLSNAMIDGLDNNCAVGQGGTFYFIKGKVQTWIGAVVSEDVTVKGQSITFKRKGKTFRGRLQKGGENFNFRRIT